MRPAKTRFAQTVRRVACYLLICPQRGTCETLWRVFLRSTNIVPGLLERWKDINNQMCGVEVFSEFQCFDNMNKTKYIYIMEK